VLLNRLKKLHYKELFLYGAFNTIIILTLVAFSIDSFMGQKADAKIDILYGLLSFIAYILFFKKHKLNSAAVALFWISVLIEVLYLEVHSIDFNIIFAFFIPIIAYISMSKRLIIINLTIFYILLISYLGYYYFKLDNNIFLHNPSYLVAYTIAHLFILSFGIFYNLAIEESIRRLEESNKVKNMLLHEVHHRVKNNLNLVASILGLNANMLDSKSTKNFLESNQKRIESMAILHEILYKQDKANSADISDYINKLSTHIIKTLAQKDVNIKCNIEHVEFPMDSMIQFGIIINELITNSIKHKNVDKLEIILDFYKCDKEYCLKYCDNLKSDIEKLESGFGYSLILLASKHFKADVKIDNKNGLCYNFRLKSGW
jgi:two-component sensor histidine kinase